MIGQPIYFGPDGHRRFAMVHLPRGAPAGCAVILPPVGYEEVCAHTSLRLLAEQLCELGVVTLRPDYDGTGNSMGKDTDADRVASWVATAKEACTEVRRWCDARPVIVGLRLGGTIAATICTEVDPAGVVLWDPVTDGRKYSRTIALLADPDSRANGIVAAAGVTFTEECLADLSRLRVDPAELCDARGLWIARPGSAAAALAEGWTRVEMNGAAELIEVDAELAVVPEHKVERIAQWVAANAERPLAETVAPPFETECHEQIGDVTIVHRAQRIGAHGVFAVESARRGPTPRTAVVLANNGVVSSVGPGRAWVLLGQRLVLDGYRVVRLDVGGLGETPAHPGRPFNDTYPPTAGSDVRDVVGRLRETGSTQVACVGLCSGGVMGFEADLAGADLAAIVAINGRFDKPFHDRRRDRRARAADQTNTLLAIPLSKTPLQPLFARIPRWCWRVLALTRLVGSPSSIIRRYEAKGGNVLLVFAPDEFGLVALRRRSGRVLDEWLAEGRVELVEIPGLDHSMFRPELRATALERCASYLRRVVPPDGGARS